MSEQYWTGLMSSGRNYNFSEEVRHSFAFKGSLNYQILQIRPHAVSLMKVIFQFRVATKAQ